MKGNIFSPEDKEFMEIVQSDLRRYLQNTIFPSRTVLIFPPFNGFRRFLVHKLIEDNFASSEVAAFSIGQDISRRIVICYKGLISDAANRGLPATIPQPLKLNMIDKEKSNRQRQTPTAAVYRPPAARIAESRKSTDNVKSADTKQTRVRRPDQQMYVPRPKRASYGNDFPRSRSRSNSRLSLDSDHSSDMKGNILVNSEESGICEQNVAMKKCCDETSQVKVNKTDNDISCPVNEENVIPNRNCKVKCNNPSNNLIESDINSLRTDGSLKPESEEIRMADENKNQETVTVSCSKDFEYRDKDENEMEVESPDKLGNSVENEEIQSKKVISEEIAHHSSEQKKNFNNGKERILQKDSTSNEAMETISISSDSKSEDSNSNSSSSSSGSTYSSDSKSSDLTVESEQSEVEKKCCKHKRSERMDIDDFKGKDSGNKSKTRSQLKEKTRKKAEPSTIKISEVLVISDSNSSDGSMKSAGDGTEKIPVNEKSEIQLPQKTQNMKVKDSVKQIKTIDTTECDWESLYDDSGECLVPSLMEELTNSVGKVRVTSADSDYRPYQSIEERTNDGECVIEIYDFPAEFKTTDLFNVFAAYRNKNFQVKWVDDTHALGIFPSPLMADEVLACTLPFVKTRPLRLGILESRTKARNLVLPPLPSVERPKTCTALARRLVTGALGLRIPTSSQEREKEKQVLKEAREKRRLEAKQKEAAWDGTITSSSVI